LQFALGLGAVGGLDAFVETREVFTNRGAFGSRSITRRVTMRRLAHAFTLGASVFFTSILGTTNCAHWLLTVDGAFSAGYLLALHLALRPLANRVADSRAGWVIALPFAHWVALQVNVSN